MKSTQKLKDPVNNDVVIAIPSGSEDESVVRVLEAKVHNMTLRRLKQPLLNKPFATLMFQKEKKSMPGKLGTISSQIIIGMARDFVWTVCTARNNDAFNGKIGAFWGCTFTQMFATAAPVLAMVRINLDCGIGKNTFFLSNRRAWVKRQLVFALASWTAIPVWNGAQLLGTWSGNQIPLSTNAGNYFAGPFTGLAETTWQNVIVIPTLLGQDVDMLDAFLNILGGAMWQWVYSYFNQEGDSDNDQYKTAAFVAMTVAFSTLIMSYLSQAIHRCFPDMNAEFEQDNEEDDAFYEPSKPNPNTLFYYPPSRKLKVELMNLVPDIKDTYATSDGIFAALINELGDSAHLLNPELCSISNFLDARSDEIQQYQAVINYAKAMNGYVVGEEKIANGFIQADGGELKKPIVAILNTRNHHWVACVILPKNYKGFAEHDGERIFLMDSLYTIRKFPTKFRNVIMQGGEIDFEAPLNEGSNFIFPRSHRVMPVFQNPQFIEECPLEQIGGHDCGWWALHNAITVVKTGSTAALFENHQVPSRAVALRKKYPDLDKEVEPLRAPLRR